MKRKFISIIIFAGLLVIGFQLMVVRPVWADAPPSPPKGAPTPPPAPAPTQIIIASQTDANLGDAFEVSGTLKDKTGAGIPDKSITFSILGQYLGQTPTQDDGSFRILINKDLPAGTFAVTATFNGAHLLLPSAANDVLTIHPSKVTVQTVPPIAGITFQMDGRQFVSDANGTASILINKIGVYQLNVLIDQFQAPGQKVTFSRWSEESYEPSRDVRVPTTDTIQVGLNTYEQVSARFIDLDGYPVDTARISGVTIKSIQGDTFNLSINQPTWIPSSRVARRSSGLEGTKLLYSVISVMMDGSNVVNSAQQRFFANPDDTWSISLLLYTLHVEARDGLFGAPVGKTVNVQFPNGQVKNYPLDSSGTLVVHSLARGIYHIELTGTNGLSNDIPVALSRNQDVNINVVTYLDLGVVGATGVAFALGLILYGRPWLFGLFVKKKQPVAQEARWTSIHEN